MFMQKATKSLVLTAVLTIVAGLFSYAQTEDLPFGDLPPTDEVGKCYAKCKAPDVYETEEKRVLVKEEATRLSVIPAKYSTQTEKVMVKEGGKTYKVIPATYKNVTEQVLVEPEKKIVKTIPAKYRTETERVMVSPARGEWVRKMKDPNCFSENADDCFILCYEEVPAVYRTESKQVLVSEAQTVEEVIPAKYKTVTKRVVDEPARTVEVPIDPVYNNVTTSVKVADEKVNEEVIPAVYKTVSERKLVKKGGYTVWTEILCADQTTSATVRKIQEALKRDGYNAGPTDGVMGLQTQTAIKQYQVDKNLPVGNLNLKTLESLGLKDVITYRKLSR